MVNIWDQIAPHRHRQLVTGEDHTFNEFLLPQTNEILRGIGKISDFVVLDIGCGTGFLTEILSHQFKKIVGIDPSKVSISYARNYAGNIQNTLFECVSVEEFAEKHRGEFDLAIAHMVLQTTDHVDITISNTSSLIGSTGWFLFSIPHPCFWLTIKNNISNGASHYHITSIKSKASNNNFQYHIKSSYTNIFRFNDELKFEIPYFHRPIDFYTSTLRSNGFSIIDIFEPIPSEAFKVKYRRPSFLPEFLFILSRKIHNGVEK